MKARTAGVYGSLAVHAGIVLIVAVMVQPDETEPEKLESISINLNLFKSVASTQSAPTPEPVTLPEPQQQPTTVKNKTSPAPEIEAKAPEPDSTASDVVEPDLKTTGLPSASAAPATRTIPVTKTTPAVAATSPTKTTPVASPQQKKENRPELTEKPATNTAPPIVDNRPVLELEQITTVNTSSNASDPAIQSTDRVTAEIEKAAYTEKVRLAVLAQRSYPQRARRKKMTGTVLVTFRVFASGELDSTTVKESSGHDLLDRAALGAVKKAGRFSPFPDEVKKQYWDFEVPIVFQ